MIHQTPLQTRREEALIDHTATLTGHTMVKFSVLATVDALMLEGLKPEYWLEVKDRATPMHQYPTLTIDALKIVRGLRMARCQRIGFILGVQWTDQLRYALIKRVHPRTFQTLRKPRDQFDIGDSVCQIPLKIFGPPMPMANLPTS